MLFPRQLTSRSSNRCLPLSVRLNRACTRREHANSAEHSRQGEGARQRPQRLDKEALVVAHPKAIVMRRLPRVVDAPQVLSTPWDITRPNSALLTPVNPLLGVIRHPLWIAIPDQRETGAIEFEGPMRLVQMITRSRLRRYLVPRTVRVRLTMLYSSLFLACAAALLCITDVLWGRASSSESRVAGPFAQIISNLAPPGRNALVRNMQRTWSTITAVKGPHFVTTADPDSKGW